jgi:hypothetical protein
MQFEVATALAHECNLYGAGMSQGGVNELTQVFQSLKMANACSCTVTRMLPPACTARLWRQLVAGVQVGFAGEFMVGTVCGQALANRAGPQQHLPADRILTGSTVTRQVQARMCLDSVLDAHHIHRAHAYAHPLPQHQTQRNQDAKKRFAKEVYGLRWA